jgi:hypothetical protein
LERHADATEKLFHAVERIERLVAIHVGAIGTIQQAGPDDDDDDDVVSYASDRRTAARQAKDAQRLWRPDEADG